MEANGRLQRSNNRGLWRQTGSCNARTTNACGQSAWWKLPRGILSILRVLRLANGRLERRNNRGIWRQTEGCNALTTEGYGGKRQAATLEQQRAMEGSGRLQRSNSRGLWRQTAGCNARTTNACGNALTTEGYGGKRRAATLEQEMLAARVLGGSCREGL